MQAILRRAFVALLVLGAAVSVPEGSALGQAPPGADLSITITGSPNPVSPGADLTYTITVSNSGPGTASDVFFFANVPFGTVFVSLAQTGGPPFTLTAPSPVAGFVSGSVATLANGASATFSLVVNVGHGSPFVSNAASVNSSTHDSQLWNNFSFEGTTVSVPPADLSITKRDSPDPVSPGGDITYTITIANGGPAAAFNVFFQDFIPFGTNFRSVSQTSGPPFTLTPPFAGVAGFVSGWAATLANGASATFSLVVTVGPDAQTVFNFATVGTSGLDPNFFNNSSFTSTTVDQPPADLALTKSESQDLVAAGDLLTYSITLKNNGPNAARSPSLFDFAPTNTTLVSAAQTSGPAFTVTTFGNFGFSATIPEFASGASATFSMVVRVNPGTTDGTVLTNVASVSTSSGPIDPNFANNVARETTTVGRAADLTVTKAASPNPVPAGGSLAYLITVTNKGPTAAQEVFLRDAIPPGVAFLSLTQTSGPPFTCGSLSPGGTDTGSDAGPRTPACTAPALASGASAQFLLTVRVNANAPNASLLSNTATVSSYTRDPDASNNTATASTTVRNAGGASLGAILSGLRRNRAAADADSAAPATTAIRPPSTGDAGLLEECVCGSRLQWPPLQCLR